MRPDSLAGGLRPAPADLAAWLLGFSLVAYLGLEGGGYDPLVYDQAGIAVWWIVLLGTVAGHPAQAAAPDEPSRTISGSVTAEAAPAAGRQLFGEMVVVTDEGAVVGRGNVSIGSVS